MNRNEEYQALLDALDAEGIPAALDGCVEKAGKKARRRSRARDWGAALASLGGVAAAFALAVNLSVPFAMACKRVPVLKDLAAAVALSPSLKAAVENDFIQYVGQTQTVNGVTLKLEYLILDQMQINFFYTVSGGEFDNFHVYPSLSGPNGEGLHGYGLTSGTARPGEMTDFNANFNEGYQVPERFRLTCKVEGRRDYTASAEAPAEAHTGKLRPDEEPKIVAEFTFDLALDNRLTGPGETLELDRWIEVDGQRLHLEALEINPTHARLKVSFDPENTAWCKGLTFTLTDAGGNRYEDGSRAGTSGILLSTGSDEENGQVHYYLESPYFAGKGPYTLHIMGAQWLDKGSEWARFDLEQGRAEGLPEGFTFVEAVREENSVCLTVAVPDNGRSGFSWDYRDPEGVEYRLNSGSYYSREREDGTIVKCDEFVLPDYPFSTVEMKLSYTWSAEYSPGIEVPLG